MEKYNLIIALIIILGVCGAVGFGFNFLKKKGIKVDTLLKDVSDVVDEAGIAIKAGKSLAPSPLLNEIDVVYTIIAKAVKSAQQLYISSQLPVDQRKIKAKEIILDGLKAVNIEDTPELDTFINSVIEGAVFDTKTPEERKAQEQNTLQDQVKSLTDTNTKLVVENQQLNEKLANVAAQMK